MGRKQVKWDAFWHLFAWLLDDHEGHALGGKIVDEFCRFALGATFECRKLTLEYQVTVPKDGKGRWADLALAIPSFDAPTHIIVMDDVDLRSPGSTRKLTNLTAYLRLARERFPSSIVRAVVLTNAHDSSSMSRMTKTLGAEAADFAVSDGWKLLPIRIVGEWVDASLVIGDPPPPKNLALFLLDFVEWSKSLDSRVLKHSQRQFDC